jgi:hypothetical protein
VNGVAADSGPPRADGWWCAGLGLALRFGLVAWGADRFPPAEDGRFYHAVAARIAEGHGYTWLWPDGVVTHAAHYPVGYPALLGLLYALAGPRPVVAMALAAVLGALAILAVHRMVASVASRRAAAIAALLVALHPALIFYTPAIMTEGVAASAVTLAAWGVVRAHASTRPLLPLTLLGLGLGLCTLIRPQTLLFVPVFGALAVASGGHHARRAALGAAWALLMALVVCLPWTLRNCARMDRCVLVSANGGWNLLIGTASEVQGSFVPLETIGVPAACQDVYGEVEKDACFRRAAVGRILEAPARWVALVPSKLGATFDYGGAPSWYLHASNPAEFDKRAAIGLGVAETIWQRFMVLLALYALGSERGPRARARRWVGWVTGLSLLVRPAWIAYLGLVCQGVLLGRSGAERRPVALAVVVTAATGITHAIFFGAGRYAMVCTPLLGVLAGLAFDTRRHAGDTRALR